MHAPAGGLPRSLRDAARQHWHHVVMLAWLGVAVAVYGRHGGQSWHFVATGARSILCMSGDDPAGTPCGLHVYAQHPDVQIGPLSLLVAAPAVAFRYRDGFDIARVVMALLGFVILLLVERGARLARRTDPDRLRLRVLLASLAFFPAWADLAVGFGHLDDVLALTFTACAVHAVTRGNQRTAGWCLALATLSKPWAAAFLPLLLGLPRGMRLRAAAHAVVPVIVAALPFVLADRQTLRAGSFRIPNADASSLRVLGVTDATPPWDRPAQLVIGLLLGAVAARVGRWQAVIMLAAATRIMLDPQVYSYYTAGVLLGAVIWDIQVRPGRTVPLWTWAVFGALFGVRYLPLAPTTLGVLRLTICLVIIVCAAWAPGLLAHVSPPRRWPHPDLAAQAAGPPLPTQPGPGGDPQPGPESVRGSGDPVSGNPASGDDVPGSREPAAAAPGRPGRASRHPQRDRPRPAGG